MILITEEKNEDNNKKIKEIHIEKNVWHLNEDECGEDKKWYDI